MLDLHCCGLSLVVVHGLLVAVASLDVVHRLNCPMACVPCSMVFLDQRLNQCLLHCKMDS